MKDNWCVFFIISIYLFIYGIKKNKYKDTNSNCPCHIEVRRLLSPCKLRLWRSRSHTAMLAIPILDDRRQDSPEEYDSKPLCPSVQHGNKPVSLVVVEMQVKGAQLQDTQLCPSGSFTVSIHYGFKPCRKKTNHRWVKDHIKTFINNSNPEVWRGWESDE